MSDRNIEKAREQDDLFDQDKAFQVAFKRFVNDIADTNNDTSIGIIEATYRALDELESQGAIGTQHLATEIEDVREIAEGAMVLAQSDGEDDNKAQRARQLTRNELVRRYVKGSGWDTNAITISKVRELARPENELEWTTVDRAFGQLAENWDAFQRTTSDGGKALMIADGVSDRLARKVSVELGRPDIANSVVGEKEGSA